MRGIFGSNHWIAVLVPLFLIAAGGAQNTIHVPADQPTIQQAISAGQSGDTVLVSPGTYTENIDFQGKAISVSSTGGASVTTLDGGGTAPVVTFQHGESTNSVLSGFTITHGTSSFEGGGIMINSASPTIENNVVTANQGCQGMGIAVAFGSPIIRGNTISNNTAPSCSGGAGGGISVRGAGSAQILNNTITGNQLPLGGFGGGIGLNAAGTPTISGNIIQHNSVYNDGGGINLVNQSDATIVQNLITDNSAGGNGGGIAWTVPSGDRGPLLINNTIANNVANRGSAIFSQGFVSNVQIINNLFYSQSVAAVDCDASLDPTPPAFSFNDAFTTGGPAYVDACSGVAGTNNNLSQDPLFTDPANAAYHLQSGSPAIDAGSNAAPDLPQKDLDGNPRTAMGMAPNCTSTVDLGAYEFVLINIASLTPTTLTFGSQALGTSSAAQLITLSATQGCVQISSVSVIGDFTQTNNCLALLTTGNQCSLQVAFTPFEIRTRMGTLTVSGNFSGQTLTAALSGTGLSAFVLPSPGSLAFGNQLINTTSTAQLVTLSNPGNLPFQITAISITGDFAQNNNCGNSVAPGASCNINVTFMPTAAGTRSGTLSIQTDQNPPTESVSLSGTGTAPIPAFSATGLSFGQQRVKTTSSPQTMILVNNGDGALLLNGFTITGSDFAQTNNCPPTLAPAQSCTLAVTFTPGARGPEVVLLSINTSQSIRTPTVGLSGTGIAPVAVLSGVTFNAQIVGTTSAQDTLLSNVGDLPLNISSIMTGGDYSQSNGCPASLGAGGSCTLHVSFTPAAGGVRNGSLVIADDDPAAPNGQTIAALNGAGLDYSLAVSPAAVAIQAGQSAQYTTTVTAVGGAFPNAVLLSCGGLPQGSSCTFMPSSVTTGSSSASSLLTITTTRVHGSHGTPAGTYVITVAGSSGNLTHTASVQLTVQ